jgi:hypothetical protein
MAPKTMDLEELKLQLIEYLAKRKDVGADEKAKEDVGKVIGGSKGNAVLEFVSLAPNKGQVIETPSNALDYDELTKYGYGHLVTPIMNAGGRLEMYKLLGIDAPAVKRPPPPPEAPKLVVDRIGENDKARYSGLRMGLLNDDAMAEALQEAQRKKRSGEPLRSALVEEGFVRPFADKRNVSPKSTPEWTPERIDEETKRQGRSNDWARRAREGQFVRDPMESLDLNFQQRVFSIFSALLVSTAFGRSTPIFLSQYLGDSTAKLSVLSFLSALQAPAGAFVLASIGSSIFCVVSSKSKNRSAIVWFIKGLLGGPLTVGQLRELDSLLTQGEQDIVNREQAEQDLRAK